MGAGPEEEDEMVDVNAKRLEAVPFTGVSYDARTDRFTAEIYIDGVRKWLGSHKTAQEASAAYVAARAARPQRETKTAFTQVYTEFRESHGGDRTDPPIGASLEYDGQTFIYAGDDWRFGRGGIRVRYALWDTHCHTCGEAIQIMAPHSPSMAKGISRNCDAHKRPGGARIKRKRSEAKEVASPAPEPKAETVLEKLYRMLAELGMVRERMATDDVVEHLATRAFPTSWKTSLDGVRRHLVRWAEGDAPGDPVFRLEDEGNTVVFI